MIKKASVIILVLVFTMFTACGVGNKIDTSIHAVDGWNVTVESVEVTDDLSSSKSAVQYSGDAVEIALNEKPTKGNVFLLINLNIEKTRAGADAFNWDNAALVDNNGNSYIRHSNDTFLQNFGFQRIKSTNLTIGKNTGYACYEIPSISAKDTLSFEYTSASDKISIVIN